MKRRDAIKGLGAIGIGAMLPPLKTIEKVSRKSLPSKLNNVPICWLTPEKDQGPFYLNADLVRRDITEGQRGVELHLVVTVVQEDCTPIPGVLVDVWHASCNGNYSAYGAFVGETFLRGTQPTDNNGVAEFDTVYPGWYPGRATHIHFKVRLNSTTYVTSQFAFPDSTNNTIYQTPYYVGRGPSPTTNKMDLIFGAAEPQYLTCYAVPNSTGGYDGPFTIGINGPIGINFRNMEIKGYALNQNYPNPFNPGTLISYSIPETKKVMLEVYDVLGNKITTLVDAVQRAGNYEVQFDAQNISSGFYFYKLTAGDFVQAKEMLLIK
ncbi:MAG: T9SS C-terminal target domain-containing protein [Ignavibacteriae bacterium]|nr:MAG: T9SS C-terminal target domain-containing protein [Ignavibacteriota bacterium]